MIGARRIERAAVVADARQTGAAPGEFLHLELADDRGACVEESCHDGGVEVRNVAVHHVRAERERYVSERNVILETDGLARERARVRALHGAAADEHAKRIIRVRRPRPRVAIREAHRWAPLLDAELLEGLEESDRVHHAGLDHPRFRRGQLEAQRAPVLGHLVDGGSSQHEFETSYRNAALGTARGCGSMMPWTIVSAV